MSDSIERLRKYLASRGTGVDFQVLRADASTRGYYRIQNNDLTAIACVYPEPFTPAEHSYLDVTNLFKAAGLPVADVIDFDGSLGVIVQEDLGDRILYDEIDSCARDSLFDDAITLIARIQSATSKAYEMNSIASRLRFDTGKLSWELDYFKTHYFTSFLKRPLAHSDDDQITREFVEISHELDARANVLCHRDFHAANLMVDRQGRLRIIDHQDARIGSVSYDLVSLLLDRVTESPADGWLDDKRRLFLNERTKLGLEKIDETIFAEEFNLQAIQRCLKAAGTFSFQAAMRGKTHYIPFIKPMFRIGIRAAESLARFSAMRDILGREI